MIALPAPQRSAVEAPETLDLAVTADRVRFEELTAGSVAVDTYDTIDQQLNDYVKVAHPDERLDDRRIGDKVGNLLGGRERRTFGRWIFYPWSRRLVHVLPPDLFGLVRESRNLHKITADERRRLRDFTIGIVGLSAGSAIARTLCLEGVGGILRIADFDDLDLSNLNRLQASIHEIGTNKAVICARQMYEVNPYASVDVFADGVTRQNLASFIGGPPRLDLLIDECDSIDVKLLLREEARAHRIPVIMQTSDRGTLDIERFDLEPERPILHGLVGDVCSLDVAGLTTEQKVEYVLKILRPQEASARGAASMLEIGKTILTWPQLASDIQLGGALVTVAARRVCLGLPLDSGRRYLEMDEVVSANHALAAAAPVLPPAIVAPSKVRNARSGSIPEMLVAYATLAPSGGNAQPWSFSSRGHHELLVARDPKAGGGYRDFGYLGSYLAIGAAIENAVIAACDHGIPIEVEVVPEVVGDDAVALLRWSDSAGVQQRCHGERLALIERRATNRRLGDGTPLDPIHAGALRGAVANSAVHLQLVGDVDARMQVGRILGTFDRIALSVSTLHAEMAAEMRWTDEEAERTLDGLDIATLELDAKDALVLQLLTRPDVAAILRAPGRGLALERSALRALTSSSAAGLIRVNGQTRDAFLEAGRAMQRVWLEATRLGLALQPWTAITFVGKLIGTPQADIFTPGEAEEVAKLGEGLDDVFRERSSWSTAMLFRVSHAEAPSARSRRRAIEDVL
jgi:molybdopterin/thiamine biosynthesis adenylyltransferase/nitroreductase